MSIEILGGHVHTEDGRRRRRTHSAEFKAKVVAACHQRGVSIAAVALAHGLNANLLRRWVVAEEQAQGTKPVRTDSVSARIETLSDTFIPVQLAKPMVASAQGIAIELRRGATVVKVDWPLAAAADCAAWLRELLR